MSNTIKKPRTRRVLTLATLERKFACTAGLVRFKTLFGEKATITEKLVKKIATEFRYSDWVWACGNILPHGASRTAILEKINKRRGIDERHSIRYDRLWGARSAENEALHRAYQEEYKPVRDALLAVQNESYYKISRKEAAAVRARIKVVEKAYATTVEAANVKHAAAYNAVEAKYDAKFTALKNEYAKKVAALFVTAYLER